MRVPDKKNKGRLIRAAMQKIPCDLTVTNCQLVNVITGEIYPAEVDVLDGFVVRVREHGEPTQSPSATIFDGNGAFLLPGFIDTHMHIESTMMIPENLSRAIVPWGTTTICTDPHEIANVLGMEGVRFMLENAKKSTLRQYALSPSCVPSMPGFEGNGASLGPKEIGELLDTPGVIGIAELMDFSGVCSHSPRMSEIIEEGDKRNVYLQAHAPSLTGKELAAYMLGGPNGDHESRSADEVREKLRNGMHINLRASSMLDDLQILLDGFDGQMWKDFVSICTDDVHAGDLIDGGHINRILGRIIEAGMNPVEAIKLCTLNAAREYGFPDLGAIAPGYCADMQLVSALDGRRPNAVFIRGQLVAENGSYVGLDLPDQLPQVKNTVQLPHIHGAKDFLLRVPDGHSGDSIAVNVLEPTDGDQIIRRIAACELPVVDGCVDISTKPDLTYVCVCNRHGSESKTIAILRDFGLNEGAFATTISHDSHNLTIVYKDPADAIVAANALKECGGGMCVVKDGKVLQTNPLPVAGLMSLDPIEQLGRRAEKTQAALSTICEPRVTLLSAAIMALPVLPGMIITDRSLVNGLTQQFVPLFPA